jgi:hypothetical protein
MPMAAQVAGGRWLGLGEQGDATPVIWRETSEARNRQALAISWSTVIRFRA